MEHLKIYFTNGKFLDIDNIIDFEITDSEIKCSYTGKKHTPFYGNFDRLNNGNFNVKWQWREYKLTIKLNNIAAYSFYEGGEDGKTI